MVDLSIIFRRTQAGTAEIQQKSHGLTQSERLVLIMIDGATPYQLLRTKLPVIPSERFDRAVSRLEDAGFIVKAETSTPAEEKLDRGLVDRFLQQDPLDPLTILLDSEKDGEDDWQFAPPAPPPRVFDRVHMEMADEVAQEVRAQTSLRASRLEPIEFAEKNAVSEERIWFEMEDKKGARRMRWSYLALALGFAFLAGFVLARIFV